MEDCFVENFAKNCELVLSENPNQPFQTYLDKIKPELIKSLGIMVEEIKDGFKNEEEGVFNWVQSNTVRIFQENLPPQQRPMAAMKAGPIVFMMKRNYEVYK